MQHPNRAAGPKETTVTTITTYKIPVNPATPGTPVQIGYNPENGMNLNEMYGELDCDLVTAVVSPTFSDLSTGGGLTLWCDDEALLKAEPELNIRASILAGQPIYGPVLVVSENHEGYCRSWSPDNPLPFIPCELDHLAKRMVAANT